MRDQKVFSNDQVHWYDEGSKRLSYQMIFKEKEILSPAPEENIDITELLDERDARWRIKLQKAKEEARAEGYKQGLQEGLDEARSEIDDKIQRICTVFKEAHLEWKKAQELMEPGILDMAFDISESILGIPVENPAIRTTIEQNLGGFLQKINEQSKPMLWISESDYDFVKEVIEEYAPHTSVTVRVGKKLNPGEFNLETTEENIVHNFQEMLHDFKENLALPSWK
jgi:flagellar biosynthesis/type III secretory pathway protein FliH